METMNVDQIDKDSMNNLNIKENEVNKAYLKFHNIHVHVHVEEKNPIVCTEEDANGPTSLTPSGCKPSKTKTWSSTGTQTQVHPVSMNMVVMISIVVVMVTSFGKVSGSSDCPTKCHCFSHGAGLHIDCHNLSLRSFPKLTENVTSLNISSNFLTSLHKEDFDRLVNLRKLDISNNNISKIDGDAFHRSSRLEWLDMQGNDVNVYNERENGAEDEPLAFLQHLDKLRYLNVQDNGEVSSYRKYPSTYITSLSQLSHLKITGLSNDTLGPEYKRLHELDTLDFSGKTCSVGKVTRGLLENLKGTNVRRISLRNCDIHDVEEGAFSGLANLYTLDLSCNPHLGKNISNLAGLKSTNLSILILNKISETNSSFDIDNTTIGELRTLDVKYLSLEDNIVGKISPKFIEWMTGLEYLSIAGSKGGKQTKLVLSFGLVHDLLQHTVLRIVDISYISGIYDKDICCGRASTLYVQEESAFPRYSPCLYKNNMPAGPDIKNTYPVPMSLQTIYMHHNSRWHGAIEFLGLFRNQVRHVDASFDNYRRIWGALNGVECLEYVDLSNNIIKDVETNAFHGMLSLKYLNLRKNMMGNLIENDTKGEFFNLSSLVILDLSMNNLTRFHVKAFSNLTSLEVMNFSRNNIYEWDDDLSNLVNLRVLDISYNNLSFFPEAQIQQLHKLSYGKNKSLTVNLTGNPWDCSNVSSVESFKATSIGKLLLCTKFKIPNLESLTCKNGSVHVMLKDTLTRLGLDMHTFHDDCFSEKKHNLASWVYFVSGGIGLLVITISVSAFLIFRRKRSWNREYSNLQDKNLRVGQVI